MVDRETPVSEVLNMLQQGLSDMDIIKRLTDAGYSPVQITDALNQAKIKKEIIGVEGLQPSILTKETSQIPTPSAYETPIPKPSIVPAPVITPTTPSTEYPAYPYQYPVAPEIAPKIETEAIEEIAEEIVNEKWSEIKGKISDVIEWKIYAEKRISSIDERIKRIESSMDRLQAALLSKVQEYQRDIKNLSAEMAGLEGAFGKILSPFVENMKELSRITEELKVAKLKKPSIQKPSPPIKKEITIIHKKAKPKQMPAKREIKTIAIHKHPKLKNLHKQAHHKKEDGKVVKEVTKITKTVEKK